MIKSFVLRPVRLRRRQIILLATVGVILAIVGVLFHGPGIRWIVSTALFWKELYKHQGFFGTNIRPEKDIPFYNDRLCDNSLLKDPTVVQYIESTGVTDKRIAESAHSLVYDAIFKSHSPADIVELTFEERCDLYFTKLYELNPEWHLDPKEPFPLSEKGNFRWEDYKEKKWNSTKKMLAKKARTKVSQYFNDEAIEATLRVGYEKFWNRTIHQEQRLVNSISHVRIYNKCYITSSDEIVSQRNTKFIEEQQNILGKKSSTLIIPNQKAESCSDLESRVYQWLSGQLPIYERWTGEILHHPPNMIDFLDSIPEPTNSKGSKGRGTVKVHSKVTNNNIGCFVSDFKDSMNGKGIVLSIGEQHVDDSVRLIAVLRALGNTLPIQFIYKDTLSKTSKSKLIKAARKEVTKVPESFKKVHNHFPDDYLGEDGLLPQEIWFVDVSNSVQPSYHPKFDGYSNKFLATFFNSFEEIMLIDADTILLESPEYFFNLAKYGEYGAYFYKDRTTRILKPLSDSAFFQKMSPSIIDNFVFDFKLPNDEQLENEYMTKSLFHYMESGLVLIDRNLHFNAILTMIHLNFYSFAKARVWGDKEIFWLSFMISGEEFHFNKHFAAAIGEVQKGNKFEANEICSAHPGHLREDGTTLEWFNSGFQYCGQSDKMNFKKHFPKQWRYPELESPKMYEAFYRSRLTIAQAIVPPYNELPSNNIDGEPKHGWFMDKEYCKGYLWCAYDRIGGETVEGDSNIMRGTLVNFSETDQDIWAYLGDTWFGED
ncbi:putative alpha-1,3-mannosyltransferase Mnn13p [[Candida] anglica]|uniref:Alpha-1,3-mannosyltransferase Mnn13p n=1 Tax=[Candida] anglica TaxID=148631 RepID=A0ABP0EB68_9ASCO